MGKGRASATQAPDLGSLADTLRQLAPEQLQELLATVGQKH
jgi:hypothetical protein